MKVFDKRLALALVLLLLILISGAVSAKHQGQITILVDNKVLRTEFPPYIEHGKIQVPGTAVAEAISEAMKHRNASNGKHFYCGAMKGGSRRSHSICHCVIL